MGSSVMSLDNKVATMEMRARENELGRRFCDDPVLFCEQVLGVKPWSMQREILESVRDNPRTAVRSCYASGKSFIAACVMLWFMCTHKPATVITTAPTFRQVESILWREIAVRFNSAIYHIGGALVGTKLTFDNNWFALGLSTNEPERFQGFHNANVLVIGDEASGLGPEIYKAIENPLSTGNTRLLLIGNPTQSVGDFRDCFTSPIYKCFGISAFDTPNFTENGITPENILECDLNKIKIPYPSLVSPQWVKDRYLEWGPGSFSYTVQVLGEFPEAGVNNLFRLSEVEGAVGRNVEKGEVALGLDISRYGDDETVLCLREGNKVCKFEAWGHQDTNYTTGRVIRFMREHKILSIAVDSVGVGGGVADVLRAEGFNVIEFNAGEKAIDSETYLNKRAEQYDKLRRRFADESISIPDNSALKGQLCDMRYTYNTKGQLQIESKEDMRSRGSKSPDKADALMISYAAPTASQRRRLRDFKGR